MKKQIAMLVLRCRCSFRLRSARRAFSSLSPAVSRL